MLTKHHVKLTGIAIIITIVALAILNFIILPSQEKNELEISQIYNEIAQNYNATTGTYKNLDNINMLQINIVKLEATDKFIKLFNVLSISIILITFAGLFANWLQFIFTTINFTISEKHYNILASALLSSAIIICVVYYLIFK